MVKLSNMCCVDIILRSENLTIRTAAATTSNSSWSKTWNQIPLKIFANRERTLDLNRVCKPSLIFLTVDSWLASKNGLGLQTNIWIYDMFRAHY